MIPKAVHRSPGNSPATAISNRHVAEHHARITYLEPKPVRSTFSPRSNTENDDEGDVGDTILKPKIVVKKPKDDRRRR